VKHQKEKTMTQPTTADAFFNSGGGKTAKFPNVGDEIEGEITFISDPEPQTKMGSDEIVVDKRTGQPKLQVRIGLATNQRDPEDEDDDGARTVYVKGWLRGAIGDALRKAGAKSLAVGGRLKVVHTGTKPSEIGLNPTKLYEASYTPPSAAATNDFFGNGAAAPAASSVPEPKRPEAISPEAWAQMDAATKKQLADIPF
jgi:hypothetical protein